MKNNLTPLISHAITHGYRRERESKDLGFYLSRNRYSIPLPLGEGFRVRSLGTSVTLLLTLSLFLSSCSYFTSTKLVNGSPAPEISLPDTTGQTLTLSSFRGNLVLLEFWASWCRPCREENPKLVKLYNKYKNTEFEKAKSLKVISVSLDSEKDKWMEAIRKDSLLLEYHLSDLQGWNSAAVDSYQFRSIPSSFLVDQNGIIIGKNLKPRDLDKLLATLAKQ